MTGGDGGQDHPFVRLASADKRIPILVGWSEPEPETNCCWFDAPLEIDGVVERSFVLHGQCRRDRPEMAVSFEMRIGRSAGRRCVPLMRVDWRSLKGGHSNSRRWRVPGAGRRVSSTHHHPFELNFDADRNKMKKFGSLPLAQEIDEALPNYGALLAFVGRVFRINNIKVVPEPDWQYTLF